MRLQMPLNILHKTYDDVANIATSFVVDLQKKNDDLIIDADENDMFDFLVACHDIDIEAAKDSMQKYVVKDTKQYKKAFTPEFALSLINDFVMANGGFKDYDLAYEALSNAIHGI